MLEVTKYVDICAGHRVIGQGGKCERSYHGHEYRIYFTCRGKVQDNGMIIDFGKIGELLCNKVDELWDHRTILWDQDPNLETFKEMTPNGLAIVSFNPTAENLAEYLLNDLGPKQLEGTNVELVEVRINETHKCSAKIRKEN